MVKNKDYGFPTLLFPTIQHVKLFCCRVYNIDELSWRLCHFKFKRNELLCLTNDPMKSTLADE